MNCEMRLTRGARDMVEWARVYFNHQVRPKHKDDTHHITPHTCADGWIWIVSRVRVRQVVFEANNKFID